MRFPVYNKLFTKILDSSVWLAPDTTRLVWITMLASMDEDGFVAMKTPQNVANRALIPLPSALSALHELENEDPEDVACPFHGRRLERVPDGWMVLKAKEYRDLITRATRQAQNRERVRRFREKGNAPVMVANDLVTPSEALADTEAEADTKVSVVRQEPDGDDAATVFSHWKTTHNHPGARLDAKRRQLIKSALDGYTPGQICESISGYLNSPHHMGQNDKGTVYDSIELMLRDSAHIDAGLGFYAKPPRKEQSALTRKNVAAVTDWVPPEMRHEEV